MGFCIFILLILWTLQKLKTSLLSTSEWIEVESTQKISDGLKNLAFNLNHININLIIRKVVQGMYYNINVGQFEPDPSLILLPEKLYINCIKKQMTLLKRLQLDFTPLKIKREDQPLIADDVYQIVMVNTDLIKNEIDYQRDYFYDLFDINPQNEAISKKMERKTPTIIDESINRNPQGRPSISHQTYHMMSQKDFTHGTLTLLNSGTPLPQMSSSFLLEVVDDSNDGIYETLKRTALISKSAGGIGLSISKIREQDSYIRGTFSSYVKSNQ